jgi:hypothetical protein
MPFYGQEELPETPSPVGRPLRTFTFKTFGGKAKEVEAQFIEFKAGHVAFWREGPDKDFQGTLVLAEANTNVSELREVTS